MPAPPIQLYLIDDEPSVSAAYARLARWAKMRAQTFASVDAFLAADVSDANACVISDVRMQGTSGLELPAFLSRAGRHLPVILVTAHDTPETRELARQAGAVAYFRKPVDDQALLDAIAWAVGGRPSAASPPPAP
jgi:FixJ family two-component response regulator